MNRPTFNKTNYHENLFRILLSKDMISSFNTNTKDNSLIKVIAKY